MFVPDPDLQKRIDSILATAPPGFAEWRRSNIEDDQFREHRENHPESLMDYFDPERLKERIARYVEMMDPYSAKSLKVAQFVEALQVGGHVVMTTLDDDEVVASWEIEPAGPGAVRRN